MLTLEFKAVEALFSRDSRSVNSTGEEISSRISIHIVAAF